MKYIATLTALMLAPTIIQAAPITPAFCEALESPATLVITEVYPAPEPGEQEFIEVMNTGKKRVSLQEWRVADSSGSPKRVEEETVLLPGQRAVLFKDQTGISLNNGGDELFLYHPSEERIDEMGYESSTTGLSWSRIEGEWVIGTPTPGTKNVRYEEEEHVTGPESTVDEPDHVPERPLETSTAVLLSEMLPNPAGPDGPGEWIELVNTGTHDVDLHRWSIADAATSYTIENQTIRAGERLVITRDESGISLNNTDETIAVVDPFDTTVDETSYTDGEEGWAWARFGASWAWTEHPTPAEANTVPPTTEEAEQSEENGITSIEDALSEKDGTTLTVEGVVTVLPGTLGSQYFYIQEEGSGVQVYSYKKTFPDLEIGDKITVAGEKTSTKGEARIKISTSDQINVHEHEQDVAVVERFFVEELTEELSGTLATISGNVGQKSGSTWTVDEQWRVQIKSATGISAGLVSTDEQVTVTGVLVFTNSEWVLYPRSKEDVVVHETELELIPGASAAPTAGAAPSIDNHTGNKANAIGLGALLLAAVMAGAFQWWRKLPQQARARLPMRFWKKKNEVKHVAAKKKPVPRVETIFDGVKKPD